MNIRTAIAIASDSAFRVNHTAETLEALQTLRVAKAELDEDGSGRFAAAWAPRFRKQFDAGIAILSDLS